MRHLVYLLLVANLVYLGWNVFEPDTATEQERRLPAIPASVSPLVLLQEREAETGTADEVTSLTDAVAILEDEDPRHVDAASIIEDEDASRADAVAILEDEDTRHADMGSITEDGVAGRVDEVSIIEGEVAGRTDEASIIEGGVAGRTDEAFIIEDEVAGRTDEASIIEDEVAVRVDEASVIEGEDTPADAVFLVEEEVSIRADEISSLEDLNEEQPPGAGAAILCQALGPFLAADELQTVESRLVDLGLQPTQRGLESREVTGYWVYLSAMPQKEVQAVLATLKKHKDTEYYVGKTNFISLGTFKSMARAERRLKDIRDMGLDPVLQNRYSTQSRWWLDIQSDGAATEQLRAIAESRPELQLVEQACY